MGLVKQAAYTGSLGHLHPSAQLRAVDLQMLVELGWTLFSLYTFFHTLYCHRSQKGKLTRGELSYYESRYPSLTVVDIGNPQLSGMRSIFNYFEGFCV